MNLQQIYDLEWDRLSGSHGNIGTREDIDFEFSFLADMKAAVGEAIAAHPFSDFIDPSAGTHTASSPIGARPSHERSPMPSARSTATSMASRRPPSRMPRW